MAALAIAAWQVHRWAVNVPYWDDFDGFLDFLIRIGDAASLREKLAISAEFHNEHRTLTTRLLTWAAHAGLGAPMDFRVLTLVAAGLFVPIAAVFVFTFPTRLERCLAAAMAGAFLFSLQHHEVLFWGGACEHVSSVFFAVFALLALQRPGRWSLATGLLLALAAAFTLAHGFVVFLAGAIMLCLQRRWRDAMIVAAVLVVAAGLWMIGYHGNPAHGTLQPTLQQARAILWFWFGMLGTPLAYGQRWVAPWLGIGVLAVTAACFLAAGWRDRLYHLGVVLYALGASLLIAVGRTPVDPHIFTGSRYRLLTCLALATTGVLLGAILRRVRPAWRAEWILAALALAYAAEKTSAHWNRGRQLHDRLMAAARYYAAHHTLHGAPTELYYDLPKAERILAESRRRGIHDLAAVGRQPAP